MKLMSARLHDKYLLILFSVSLPMLHKSGRRGICSGPQGVVPVSTTTTDGILLCLGMTSGRHKEDHKNAKNTGTSWLRFTTGCSQRQQTSWALCPYHDSQGHGAHHTIMTVLDFGDKVWQASKHQKIYSCEVPPASQRNRGHTLQGWSWVKYRAGIVEGTVKSLFKRSIPHI